MLEDKRIHVFGASGAGTTTLGIALAQQLTVPHFDVDDVYWRRTDPPFVEKYTPEQRLAALYQGMAPLASWVLSGSLCGWGDVLVPSFTHTVFLYVEPGCRLQRLRRRERQRHGDRILPGKDMHHIHTEFLAWAERYDNAGIEQRSKLLHQRWSESLPCPILQLDGDQSIGELVDRVLHWLC